MKLTLRNTCFQPLTFTLAGGGSIHLRSREKTTISEKEVSSEIRLAVDKGLVDLMPQTETATRPAADTIPSDDTRPKRKGKE